MAITLTCKIEAAGSRQAGEIMVSVFFRSCAVCCGCVCWPFFYHMVLYLSTTVEYVSYLLKGAEKVGMVVLSYHCFLLVL